ncbi:MAG: rhodanese-like domain-containing protein [Synechococcales cyanobacterium]
MSQSLSSISVTELQHRWQTQGSLQIIDVREDAELALARLSGDTVLHFPLSRYDVWQSTILASLDLARPVYVLCHHGMRSAQMAQWLVQQGVPQVINISGGIDAWAQQVDPSVGVY